jgi:hypothetical protein
MLHLCEQVHTVSKKALRKKTAVACFGPLRGPARLSPQLSDVLILTDFACISWDKARAGWAEDCLMGPARELRVAGWCTGSPYAGNSWPRNMRGCHRISHWPPSRAQGCVGLTFAICLTVSLDRSFATKSQRLCQLHERTAIGVIASQPHRR